MMRAGRRIAGLLGAGVLAAGLSTGIGAGAAQAAIIPQNTWYELWVPYANPTAHKCLDVPDGSTAVNVKLQIFHCHGYDSSGGNPQRWYFTFDPTWQAYMIWNAGSGLCVDWSGFPNHQVVQGGCGYPSEEWKIVPDASGDTFQLENADFTDQCLAVDGTSANDHSPVVTGYCDWPASVAPQQDWSM